MNIPKGWTFDKGDPSVGIFGDQWIHEDCPQAVSVGPSLGLNDEELQGCTEEVVDQTEPDEHGVAILSYLITCQDCGQAMKVKVADLVMVND